MTPYNAYPQQESPGLFDNLHITNVRIGARVGRWGGPHASVYANITPDRPRLYGMTQRAQQQQVDAQQRQALRYALEDLVQPLDQAERYPAGDPRHAQAIELFEARLAAFDRRGLDGYVTPPQGGSVSYGVGQIRGTVNGTQSVHQIIDNALRGHPELAREIGARHGVTFNSAQETPKLGDIPAGVKPLGSSKTGDIEQAVDALGKAASDLSMAKSPETAKLLAAQFAESFKASPTQLYQAKENALVPASKGLNGFALEQGKIYSRDDLIREFAAHMPAETSKALLTAFKLEPLQQPQKEQPPVTPAPAKGEVAPAAAPAGKLPKVDANALSKGDAQKLQAAMEALNYDTNQQNKDALKDRAHIDPAKMDGLFQKTSNASLQKMADKAGMKPEEVAGVLLNGDAQQKQDLMKKLGVTGVNLGAKVGQPGEQTALGLPRLPETRTPRELAELDRVSNERIQNQNEAGALLQKLGLYTPFRAEPGQVVGIDLEASKEQGIQTGLDKFLTLKGIPHERGESLKPHHLVLLREAASAITAQADRAQGSSGIDAGKYNNHPEVTADFRRSGDLSTGAVRVSVEGTAGMVDAQARGERIHAMSEQQRVELAKSGATSLADKDPRTAYLLLQPVAKQEVFQYAQARANDMLKTVESAIGVQGGSTSLTSLDNYGAGNNLKLVVSSKLTAEQTEKLTELLVAARDKAGLTVQQASFHTAKNDPRLQSGEIQLTVPDSDKAREFVASFAKSVRQMQAEIQTVTGVSMQAATTGRSEVLATVVSNLGFGDTNRQEKNEKFDMALAAAPRERAPAEGHGLDAMAKQRVRAVGPAQA